MISLLNPMLAAIMLVAAPGLRLNQSRPTIDDAQAKTRPIDFARRVNVDLRDWYRDLASKSGAVDATEIEIDRLRDLIGHMSRIEPGIGANYSIGPLKDVNAAIARRYYAMAWLHAWAITSRMADGLGSATARTPDESLRSRRAKLLGLAAEGRDASALKTLLLALDEIASKQDKGGEPFRALLHDAADSGLRQNLAYEQPWLPGEDRSGIVHPWSIPRMADLMGKPDDAPGPRRGLFSLWGLVNRELDAWRDEKAGVDNRPTRPDLGGLALWLKALGESADLTGGFDRGRASGADFRVRVAKLHRFVRFRNACLDEKDFGGLLTAIRVARLADPQVPLGRVSLKEVSGPEMADLIEAAKPLEGGEMLPHARIWLRYVLLMSYRDQGAGAVASGLATYWKDSGMAGQFLDLPVNRPADHATAAFARWNACPPSSHFDRELADVTSGNYRYARWLKDALPFEKARHDAALLRDSAGVVMGLARSRSDEIRRIRADASSPDPTADTKPSASQPRDAAGGATSDHERAWLARDVCELAARLGDSARFQEAVATAYRGRDASVIATAGQAPGSAFSESQFNPHALPTRTFSEYSSDLKAASALLRQDSLRLLQEVELKGQYRLAQEEVAAANAEFAAAKFGLDFAEKGIEVADLYTRISSLEQEVAKLNKEASEALVEAADLELKSSGKSLALATRVRDLAAAELEALESAFKEAEMMVKRASDELEAMKPRLLEAAGRIEDQRNKAGLFNFIRAIVSVVGAALGPFTGGASMAISAMANSAISIVEKAEGMDFSNLGSSIANVATLAGDAAALGERAIGQFGGPELQKTVGEFKSWMNEAKGEVDKIGGQAREVLNGLKALDKNLIGPTAAALLSDLPVNLGADGRTVTVSFGAPKLRLQGDLNTLFADLLNSGGVVTGDARARLEGLASLAVPDAAKDPEYQANLKKAIDAMVVAMPDELLAKVNGKVDAAKADIIAFRKQIDDKKAEIKREIDKGDKLKNELLAKVFAGGLMVTFDPKDPNQVVVLERPIAKELAAFKARIHAFEKQVVDAAVSQVADRCKAHIGAISRASEEAQARKDGDGRLRELAKSIPSEIESIQKELEELTSKIAAARGKLDDAEIGVEIATLHRDSLEFFKKSAVAQRQAADLEVKVKEHNAKISEIQVQQAGLVRLQHGELIVARRINRESAEGRLRHIDRVGRLNGLDLPHWQELDAAAKANDHPRLAETLIVRSTGSGMEEALLIDRMTQAYVGMLRWISLLDAPDAQGTRGPRSTAFRRRSSWANHRRTRRSRPTPSTSSATR